MNTTTETTTRDVLAHYFAEEWLLVTENEAELTERLYESAKEALESETPVAVLGDQLREEWERLAEQVKDLVTEQISEVAGLYIAQMLQGWGTYPFDIIARQTIERVKDAQLETRVYEWLSSSLKTGEK